MDLKEKVTEALRRSLVPDSIVLEDDDGISGFVVSAKFRRMTALDRQRLIDQILRDPESEVTKPELRRILAIAALTPAEYEFVELRSRVS